MTRPIERAPRPVHRRTALALGVGAAAGLASGGASAATLLPGGTRASVRHVYDLRPRAIADGVWVISGAADRITAQNGGAIANVLVFDTNEGSVIVDTGPSYRYGVELDATARALTGKPVARVFITHIHADHSLGATAFPEAALYAPAGLAGDLKLRGNDITGAMYRVAGDWMRGTGVPEPRHVAAEGVEEVGQRRFRCLPMSGHTSSDLCLFEERSGLLVTGDLVFLDRAPTTPDADLPAWRRSLATLADVPHAALVPGHGPVEVGTRGIAQTKAWLDFVEEAVATHFDDGLDMAEMMTQAMPGWTQKVAVARYEYQRSVMHLLPRLEASRLPILS